jgi:arabinose-5-phosphate isomerase
MKGNWMHTGRNVLMAEARAIAGASRCLDQNLARAVQLILDHPGKVVVSGIGKSDGAII